MKEDILNDYIEINNEKILYTIKRKKIKNMSLRVTQNKEIIVSMPIRMPIDAARKFIVSKYKWIKKQLQNVDLYENKKENINFENGDKVYLLGKCYTLLIKSNKYNDVQVDGDNIIILIKESKIENKEYIQNVYQEGLKSYSLLVTKKIIEDYDYILKKYNIQFPNVEIRKMKSRWGTCFPFKNKVVFNLSLIKTPMECVQYVVLHELSHFKYHNHSKQFYSFIEQFMSDWKARRNRLNKEFANII